MLSLMSHAKLLLLWLVVCGGERLVAANSRNALSYAVPTCINNRGASYVVDRHISVDILSVNRTESGKNCPYAIDHKGKHRYAEHMCFGANTTFICIMKMVNITVSNWGALMEGDHHSKKIVSLRDDTLVGGHPPRYWPDATQTLLKGVTIALQKFRPMNSLIPARSLVIPTRYRWDDCFNHLSFQSMPLIGMVYEFQPDIFFSSYWHASQFTAALLLLLGVRMDRLIIGENVYAKSVVLPWVPHWNPIQGAPMRGISRRVSLLATSALLNISSLSTVETISPLDFRLQPLSVNSIGADERFIVYFQRSEGRRFVENEKEVLAAITQHLRPGYRVVVMPPTKEYKTIDKLHAVWRQYAQIVNRAIVIIGPHGKFVYVVVKFSFLFSLKK